MAVPGSPNKRLSHSVFNFYLQFFFKSNYNKQSHFFSGINFFRNILNDVRVINSISNLNKHNKSSSIPCFDFTGLSTKISHEKLIEVVNEISDFCFEKVDRKSLSINMVLYELNITQTTQ